MMSITLQRRHFTNGRLDHNKIAKQKVTAKLNYEYKRAMGSGQGDWETVERGAAQTSAAKLHGWAIRKYPNRNHDINNGRTLTKVEQPDGHVVHVVSVSIPTTTYTRPGGEVVQQYGHCTMYFRIYTHEQQQQGRPTIEWSGLSY